MIICEIIVNLLVIVQNNLKIKKHVLFCSLVFIINVVEDLSLFGGGIVSLGTQIAPFQKDRPYFMFGGKQRVI